MTAPATFTQRRQIGVCKICRAPIYRIPCRLDGGPEFYDWNHEATHDHSAAYLEGQRTTPAEGMILLAAWLKWHGHVLRCEVRDDEEMRLYSVTEQETGLQGGTGAYLTDMADVSDSPVLHSWSTVDAKTWHETYKVEPS